MSPALLIGMGRAWGRSQTTPPVNCLHHTQPTSCFSPAPGSPVGVGALPSEGLAEMSQCVRNEAELSRCLEQKHNESEREREKETQEGRSEIEKRRQREAEKEAMSQTGCFLSLSLSLSHTHTHTLREITRERKRVTESFCEKESWWQDKKWREGREGKEGRGMLEGELGGSMKGVTGFTVERTLTGCLQSDIF